MVDKVTRAKELVLKVFVSISLLMVRLKRVRSIIAGTTERTQSAREWRTPRSRAAVIDCPSPIIDRFKPPL